jgi:hypothetical protein
MSTKPWAVPTSVSPTRFHDENTHPDLSTEPTVGRFVDRHHEDMMARPKYAVGGHHATYEAGRVGVDGVGWRRNIDGIGQGGRRELVVHGPRGDFL